MTKIKVQGIKDHYGNDHESTEIFNDKLLTNYYDSITMSEVNNGVYDGIYTRYDSITIHSNDKFIEEVSFRKCKSHEYDDYYESEYDDEDYSVKEGLSYEVKRFYKFNGFYQDNNLKIGVTEFDWGIKIIGQMDSNSDLHGIGMIIYNNGAKYCGEFSFGERQGKGIFYNSDGSKFICYFEDDKLISHKSIRVNQPKYNSLKHSIELNILADGTEYIGSVVNGIPEGVGVLTTDDEIYSGFFKNGKLKGIGTHCTKDAIYHGKFSKGKKNGQGTYFSCEGKGDFVVVYKGFFRNNKYHGLGFLEDHGWTYKGEFKDGKFNGKGCLRGREAQRFLGEFSDNKKNGLGFYHSPYDELYEGSFVLDKMDGNGELITRNNEKYNGEFSDNKYNGKGTLESERSIYKGDFINGKKCGFGVESFNYGEKYEGQYESDEYHGVGTEYVFDGSIYKGEFYKGKRHGLGQYIDSNNNTVQVEFDQNKVIGKNANLVNVHHLKDGSIFYGELKKGNPFGKGKLIDSNGDIYLGNFISSHFATESVIHGQGYKVEKDSFYNELIKGEFQMGKLLKIPSEWEIKNSQKGLGFIKNDTFRYVGNKTGNRPSGEGLLESGDQIFLGKISNENGQDKLNGKGAILNDNHQIFKGSFSSNRLINKDSIIKLNDGISFIGQIKQGNPSGFGFLVYRGYYYAVNYKGDQFESLGCHLMGRYESPFIELTSCQGITQFSLSDGSKFIGEFKNGQPHGIGVLFYTNGNIYLGQFQGGLLEGRGTLLYKGKKQYIGEFRNGRAFGQGIKRSLNNSDKVYSGGIEDGLKHGFGCYAKNGVTIISNFKKNKLDGETVVYQSNGKIEFKHYKDGKESETYISSFDSEDFELIN